MKKEELELLRINYFQNDKPVPYKLKNGTIIFIYPIQVKDYPLYEYSKLIMDRNKNEINDIRIIQKTYLEFIVDILMNNEENKDLVKEQFYNFLNLTLHQNKFSIILNKNNRYVIFIQDDKKEYYINSKDFDNIRQIIFYQNDPDYDDSYVDPDVQELYEEYVKTKYKNVVVPSLEQKKVYVMSKTGYSLKEINEMSYRFFIQIYNISVQDDMYIADKIIQSSMKYDVKKEIHHPLFTKKVNKYAEIFVDPSTLQKKGISGAENLNKLN